MLSHKPIKCLPIDFRSLRCPRDVPSITIEHTAQICLLESTQVTPLCLSKCHAVCLGRCQQRRQGCRGLVTHQFDGNIAHLDDGSGRQDAHSSNDVLKFADIPRPSICLEHAEHLGCEALLRPSVDFAIL